MSATAYKFDNKAGEIYIDGEIGNDWYGTNMRSIRYDLNMVGDVKVMLSSIGGDVAQGFAIRDLLKIHAMSNSVEIVGVGIVASIATVIMQGASKGKRKMTANSFFMIHRVGIDWLSGNADEIRDTADTMDKMEQMILDSYVKASRDAGKLVEQDEQKTKDYIYSLMKKETYLTAKEALDLGFIDEIVEETEYVTIQNVQSVKARIQNLATPPKEIVEKIKNIEAMQKENEIEKEVPTNEGGIKNAIKKVFNWLFGGEAEPNSESKIEKEMTQEQIEAKLKALGYAEQVEEEEMTEEEMLAAYKNMTGKTFVKNSAKPEAKPEAKKEPKAEPKASVEKTDIEKQFEELKQELARVKAQAKSPEITDQKKKGPVSKRERALGEVTAKYENGLTHFHNVLTGQED